MEAASSAGRRCDGDDDISCAVNDTEALMRLVLRPRILKFPKPFHLGFTGTRFCRLESPTTDGSVLTDEKENHRERRRRRSHC